MNERLDKARRLGRRIDAGWRAEDIEGQLARLNARRQRRWAVAVPLGLAVTAAIAVIVFGAAGEVSPPVAREAVAERAEIGPSPVIAAVPVPVPVLGPEPAPGALSLGDGSVVTPLGKTSRLLARRVSDSEVVVALADGDAHFDVPARAERRFRADVGPVVVETRGAAFRVRVAQRQIEVMGERGEVKVRWGREQRVVVAGETRVFPVTVHEDVLVRPGPEPPPEPPPSLWREDAARGDYPAAWAALERVQAPLESMADLLLAGDVARLSGHPAAAVVPLSRAMALHAADPRAPLAAFTLGRVHLEELGAPREAALVFARARALAPDGPLAEDALAREVEAWSRGGETETARARALTYAQRYPAGRRARAVRRFGGLEHP